MPPFDPITEDDLNAFIDGGLDVGRRADVERWLARHPEEAARVMADLGTADLLRVGLGEDRFDAPPDAATRQLAGRLRRRLLVDQAGHVLRRVAAVVVLLGAGYGINWLVPGYLSLAEAAHRVPLFADEAAEAYRTAMREDIATRGLTYADTAVPARLAALHAGRPPLPVPGPPTPKWRLLGAQLTAWDNGDAIQVFWQHDRKGTVVLFVAEDTATAMPQTLPPTLGHTDEGEVVYWRSGPYVYALLGNADTRVLERVAQLVASPDPQAVGAALVDP
ncbi:anti-sigma factor family protein [Niveispirillum fermenti]|uniref:anti-sigma factor family protein n=1 Tax=Niveispirillum fermenti TaxID=1233113 RepID=UPI003A8927C2